MEKENISHPPLTIHKTVVYTKLNIYSSAAPNPFYRGTLLSSLNICGTPITKHEQFLLHMLTFDMLTFNCLLEI